MIGEAAALAAAFCWAVGSYLWGRIGRGATISPGALNLGKCVAGTLAFAATGVAMNGRPIPDLAPRPMAWLALSGVVGLTLGDSAYFGSMALLGVRRALLLLSTAPLFAAIGGALWLDEPLRGGQPVAIAVTLLGVAVVVNEQGAAREAHATVRGRPLALGILLGLGSGVGQAAGSLVSRAAMAEGVRPLDTALVRVPAALAAMLVLAGLSGRLGPWVRSIARPRLAGAITVAALIGTYCGIWLAQLAIGRASSTAVASTLLATSPLFALPLGRVLEREPVTARALVGTVLACAGLGGLILAKS